MEQLVFGIGSIIAGVVLLAFPRRIAESFVRDQNATWGFRFGAREVEAGARGLVIVGIGFLILGIVGLVSLALDA
jgi:hypothetical protein